MPTLGRVIRCPEQLNVYVCTDLAARGLPVAWGRDYRKTQPVAYYQWILRRSEYYQNGRRDLVGRAWSLLLRHRLNRLGRTLGFQVPLNVFGPGMVLRRPATVRVHPDARVGNHCSIAGDAAISADADGAPEVGYDVWIGSGAEMVGDITIGNGATILPGSLVVESVPPGATVSGSPARVVSYGHRSSAA